MITSFLNDQALIGQVGSSNPVRPPTDDPNLWAWFSSDTGISNSSNKINVGTSVWMDRSAGARHLDVGISQQPSYYTISSTIPSGKPEVVFENLAGDNRLTMPSSITGLTIPWTIYMLVKFNAASNNKYLCDGLTSGFGCGGIVQHTCTPCFQGISRTGATAKYGPITGGSVIQTWHVIKVIFDGTNTYSQVDNMYEQVGICGSDAPGRLSIGNYGGGGPNSAKFSLGAFIVCTGASSAAMQTLHKTWLSSYAGISLIAPSTTTPLDDPNLFAWYSSDTGLTNSGGNVGSGNNIWTDRGTQARNMNTSAGSAPAYSASGPNGKPMISFLDAGSKTVFQTAVDLGLRQPWSIYALLKINGWTNNRYFWDGNGATTGALLQDGSNPLIKPYAGSFGPFLSPSASTWLIISIIYDGANAVSQINNVTEVTGSNVGAIDPQRMKIGNYGGGGSNSGFWDLAALIISSGHNSSAARTLHKNWLASYGGITI